jgi:hypothetical protein
MTSVNLSSALLDHKINSLLSLRRGCVSILALGFLSKPPKLFTSKATQLGGFFYERPIPGKVLSGKCCTLLAYEKVTTL